MHVDGNTPTHAMPMLHPISYHVYCLSHCREVMSKNLGNILAAAVDKVNQLLIYDIPSGPRPRAGSTLGKWAQLNWLTDKTGRLQSALITSTTLLRLFLSSLRLKPFFKGFHFINVVIFERIISGKLKKATKVKRITSKLPHSAHPCPPPLSFPQKFRAKQSEILVFN